MKKETHDLLQKIYFAESDLKLHKHILASIPSVQKKKKKEVKDKIKVYKDKIKKLKNKIKIVDPEEAKKIDTLQKAINTFKKISQDKKFQDVKTLDLDHVCKIKLKDGSIIDCLVAAVDDEGDWTVITIDGETQYYASKEVSEHIGRKEEE